MTNELAIGAALPKRKVVLLEYSPQLPVGYTINLLKAAALAVPRIREHYDIDCHMLSAQEYPYEAGENTHNRKDNAILSQLAQDGPAIIGLSVFVWNYNFFKRFTKLIRLTLPDVKIIWGGKLVENHWQVLADENPDVDCLCLGEGELMFREYLLRFIDGEITEPLPGTAMKVGSKLKLSTEGLPLPELGDIPNPYVEKLIDPRAVMMANIETLRGCIYHCTFCDWGGKNYRTFSDDYVDQAIKAIMEQRFDNVFFMDSIFAMKTSRRKRFLRTVLDHYNDHSVIGFELFMEMVDDETAEMFRELARRGGLAKIEIGLQTTNPPTSVTIRRPFNRERFIQRYNGLVRDATYIQDKIQIDLIIGLPCDTYATFGEAINFVFSLDPGKVSAFPLEIFPGSEMHGHQMKKYKLSALDVAPFSLISTADMTAFEIQKLTVLAWVFTSMRSLIRRSLFYAHHMTGENIFQLINGFADWCEKHGHVESWYDYGDLVDHAVRLVQYLSSGESTLLVHGELGRLQRTLLFELAPIMIADARDAELAKLWRRPSKAELPGAGTLVSRDAAPRGLPRALFWIGDIAEYQTHPESSAEALRGGHAPFGMLVEAQGRSYRTRRLSYAEFEAGAAHFPLERLYIARTAYDSAPSLVAAAAGDRADGRAP